MAIVPFKGFTGFTGLGNISKTEDFNVPKLEEYSTNLPMSRPNTSYSQYDKGLGRIETIQPDPEPVANTVALSQESTPTENDSSVSSPTKALINRIAIGEGTTDIKAKKHGYNSAYDITLGFGKFADDKSKPITSMTISEVYALQKRMKSHPDNKFKVVKNGKTKYYPSSAVGLGQFIEPTLRGLQKKLNLPSDTVFTPEIQDRMMEELLNERGLKKFKSGKLSASKFQKNLSDTWASIDRGDGKTGQGQHLGTSSKDLASILSLFSRA